MGRNTAIAALVASVFVLQFPEQGDCGLLARRQFVVSDGSWVNDYDGALAFDCPDHNQAISGLYSEHSDSYEDRRFQIECRDLPETPGQYSQSWASGYENQFDEDLDFDCPFNSVMTGMQSHHDGHYEDRRWKFTCSSVPTFCLYGCQWTRFNEFDGKLDVSTREGYFFSGAQSKHSDYYEDRQWSYKRCRLVSCQQLIQG